MCTETFLLLTENKLTCTHAVLLLRYSNSIVLICSWSSPFLIYIHFKLVTVFWPLPFSPVEITGNYRIKHSAKPCVSFFLVLINIFPTIASPVRIILIFFHSLKLYNLFNVATFVYFYFGVYFVMYNHFHHVLTDLILKLSSFLRTYQGKLYNIFI